MRAEGPGEVDDSGADGAVCLRRHDIRHGGRDARLLRALIPIMMAARYDAVTAVAVILLGAGVGVLGSTVNAFATVIASDAAGPSLMASCCASSFSDFAGSPASSTSCATPNACGSIQPVRSSTTQAANEAHFTCSQRRGNEVHRPAQDRARGVCAHLRRHDLGRSQRRLVEAR